jgi:excisionase family DNA binding protein
MPTVPQPETSLGALDFPAGRTSLRIREVAQKLEVSDRHVLRLIDSGELATVSINHVGGKPLRTHSRVTIDSYRAFVLRRLKA